MTAHPRLRYLLPNDLRLLLEALESTGQFRVVRDNDGQILQIDHIA
jgi:hypothetical protein